MLYAYLPKHIFLVKPLMKQEITISPTHWLNKAMNLPSVFHQTEVTQGHSL